MNVNLLPREPVVTRFFYGWLTIVIVLLAVLLFTCHQVYTWQVETVQAVSAHVQELQSQQETMAAELKAYQEREAFWETHEPYYRYQEVVNLQEAAQFNWEPVLADMTRALPQGGQIFRLEATGDIVQGLGAVSAMEGVASFAQYMQQSRLADNFILELAHAPDAFAPLYVDPESATVFRFKFRVMDDPGAEESNGGAASNA